jgi:hypothetical protein
MRKDIKAFLEQNNFVYENRDFTEYVPGNSYYNSLGGWVSEYHQIYYRQYKYFQVMLFVAPHFDKRFPPHKKRGYIFTPYLTKQEHIESYIYTDCVYFKMRNIELDYGKQANQTDEYATPLRCLTKKMNTYQGIRKMRKLHKKLCPTKFKGNWKNMSIPQLKKMITEFETYDLALEKAIKERKMLAKVNKISEDFV